MEKSGCKDLKNFQCYVERAFYVFCILFWCSEAILCGNVVLVHTSGDRRMNMEHQLNDTDKGYTNYAKEKNLSQCTLSTTVPHIILGANPGLRDGKSELWYGLNFSVIHT